ncbi:hypothetical protein Q9Q94_10250 [Uliginosibacterium sp. 31-16]|uniref:hypothetical protein n=1 Tax=Uliginosibacterium sp. 31-16 TaxID=3068315 RepID=UPI00273D4483|nr:hypothetical protein [Uliginosibacterium sp. 31-16]MDP5239916.1 hypothetical protein [Uliginosibacterium sp. 31-16]
MIKQSKSVAFDLKNAVPLWADLSKTPDDFFDFCAESQTILGVAGLLKERGDVALRVQTAVGDAFVCLHYDPNESFARKRYVAGDPASLNCKKTSLWDVGDQSSPGPSRTDYSGVPGSFDMFAQNILELVFVDLVSLEAITPAATAQLAEGKVA